MDALSTEPTAAFETATTSLNESNSTTTPPWPGWDPIQQRDEEMVTIAVSVSITLLFFLIATLQYLKKKYFALVAKKQRRKLQEEKKRATCADYLLLCCERITVLENQCFRKESDHLSAMSKALTEVPDRPISLQEFQAHVEKNRKQKLYKYEFMALLRVGPDATNVARMAINTTKNADPTVIPTDESRVVLHPKDIPAKDLTSDYINASYIDGYRRAKTYIASQGPLENTVKDFWLMVWQEACICIAMVTGIIEHGREETKQKRVIRQFQLANWPEVEAPDETAMFDFRRRVKQWSLDKGGPLLVHCSNGGGRTGTFIALDIIFDTIAAEGVVDIFHVVENLRKHRPDTVANLEHYIFLHDAVLDHVLVGSTLIHCNELSSRVKRMRMKHPETKLNDFEKELKLLDQLVAKLSVGDCAAGFRNENRRKSRDILLQPPERARPYLWIPDISNRQSTDYINAVFVDGFRRQFNYIVTEWPQKCTIHDFWRLVHDSNTTTIVLLESFNSGIGYPKFWPDSSQGSTEYGPLLVENIKETNSPEINCYQFVHRKKFSSEDPMTMATRNDKNFVSFEFGKFSTGAHQAVQMFQAKFWPKSSKSPESFQGVLNLFEVVYNWQKSTGDHPIIVVSRNGYSRCGMFTAVMNCCERLIIENEVDVFRTVKRIRMNRPRLVPNVAEYQSIFHCVHFLLFSRQFRQKLRQHRHEELLSKSSQSLSISLTSSQSMYSEGSQFCGSIDNMVFDAEPADGHRSLRDSTKLQVSFEDEKAEEIGRKGFIDFV